jgi:hypothetical protein
MWVQLIYTDGPGNVSGYPAFTNPNVAVDFDAGDQIVGAFGSFQAICCWFTGFRYLGFWMRSGKQYGPYGYPSMSIGNYIAFYGNIYSIYSSAGTNNQPYYNPSNYYVRALNRVLTE